MFQNKDTIVFTDTKFYIDTESVVELNTGAGIRKILHDRYLLGAYGYYDVRETKNNNTFNQATIGLELMTRTLEARLNYYLASHNTKEVSRVVALVRLIKALF